jgi:hypothetical protein
MADTPLSLEQKILQAATVSEQAVALFSPVAAQAIAAGVAVEPVFSGLAKLILGIFKHHVSKA